VIPYLEKSLEQVRSLVDNIRKSAPQPCHQPTSLAVVLKREVSAKPSANLIVIQSGSLWSSGELRNLMRSSREEISIVSGTNFSGNNWATASGFIP